MDGRRREPEAVASKTALWPSSAVTLAGCLVTLGAFCTVSVAASLVASPTMFLKVARYWWPLSDVFAPAIVSVLDVPPATAVQVLPPLAEVSHLIVGDRGTRRGRFEDRVLAFFDGDAQPAVW